MQRDDGSWLIAGSMPVDEMAERLGIAMTQQRGYHTAAGFILSGFGYLPEIGDSFSQAVVELAGITEARHVAGAPVSLMAMAPFASCLLSRTVSVTSAATRGLTG